MQCPLKCYKNTMESWVLFLEARKSKFQLTISFYVSHGNLFFLISLISLFLSFETSDCYIARVLLYVLMYELQCKTSSNKLRVK